MKTKKATLVSLNEQIQLIDGQFTPQEAMDILKSMLNQKINFHKVERLRWWMNDHNSDNSHADRRISELVQEKIKLESFLKPLLDENAIIQIDGNIKISIVQNED